MLWLVGEMQGADIGVVNSMAYPRGCRVVGVAVAADSSNEVVTSSDLDSSMDGADNLLMTSRAAIQAVKIASERLRFVTCRNICWRVAKNLIYISRVPTDAWHSNG